MSNESIEEMIAFNGINMQTGGYLTPPMTVEALAETASRFTFDKSHFQDLAYKNSVATEASFGLSAEYGDPSKLKNAGWGIIFPALADEKMVDAILDALDGLIQLRRQQAGKRFKIYRAADGYRCPDGKPEKTIDFLVRHGTIPGPVDPNLVPAYLLIVADPQSIPFQFQYELDVDFYVGRIYFQTLEEYARYAQSVVLAETGKVSLPRKAVFFGTANPGDKATRLSADNLVKPLSQFVQQQSDDNEWGWQSRLVEPEDADRTTLKTLLGGSQSPALLFTATHGAGWPAPDKAQYEYQGALVCQDWQGPDVEAAGPQHLLAAKDVPEANSPLGMMAFFFACYSAGTPYWNAFAAAKNQPRAAITARPFLAALPTHLLSHPNGGALAVVGHIERAFSYSFSWSKLKSQTVSFRSLLSQLLDNKPIGLALDQMNLRYASLATTLKELLEEAKYTPADPYDLTFLWTATNDARGYALLGDPAVRLPVAQAGSDEVIRPAIQLSSHPAGNLPVVFSPEGLAGLTPEERLAAEEENAAS